MDFKSAQKLEKGDILINLNDKDTLSDIGAYRIERYSTVKVKSVKEEDDNIEIDYIIESGEKVGKEGTLVIDKDDEYSSYGEYLVKRTPAKVEEFYKEFYIASIDKDIKSLSNKIQKLRNKRWDKNNEMYEAMNVKSIDSLKEENAKNLVKDIRNNNFSDELVASSLLDYLSDDTNVANKCKSIEW